MKYALMFVDNSELETILHILERVANSDPAIRTLKHAKDAQDITKCKKMLDGALETFHVGVHQILVHGTDTQFNHGSSKQPLQCGLT